VLRSPEVAALAATPSAKAEGRPPPRLRGHDLEMTTALSLRAFANHDLDIASGAITNWTKRNFLRLRGEEDSPKLGDVFVVVVRDAAKHVANETVPCDELSENGAYRSRFIRQALREFLKVSA
jgi:hypothetical protein